MVMPFLEHLLTQPCVRREGDIPLKVLVAVFYSTCYLIDSGTAPCACTFCYLHFNANATACYNILATVYGIRVKIANSSIDSYILQEGIG